MDCARRKCILIKINLPSHNRRGIRIDPQQQTLEQTIHAELWKPTPQRHHTQQTRHVRMADTAIAKEGFVGSHLGHGGDELVGGSAFRVFEGGVDFADGHAAQLEELDGVGVGTVKTSVARCGDEDHGVESCGVGCDEGVKARAEEVTGGGWVNAGDVDDEV